MHVTVTDAKGRLTDLVRRAQAGEEVVLTRHGQPAARLVPIKAALDQAGRRKLLDFIRQTGSVHSTTGASAARSQDFLYNEAGLPE